MRKSHQSFWLLSLAVITYWRYAIFNAIYPKLCYLLYHIPRSSAIFFLNVMLQYIALTPSYANSSYAMFSGQSRGRISGYCIYLDYLNFFPNKPLSNYLWWPMMKTNFYPFFRFYTSKMSDFCYNWNWPLFLLYRLNLSWCEEAFKLK